VIGGEVAPRLRQPRFDDVRDRRQKLTALFLGGDIAEDFAHLLCGLLKFELNLTDYRGE
jgi:hypothetical protein